MSQRLCVTKVDSIILAIMNNEAMNMGREIPFRDSDFIPFGHIYSVVGLLYNMAVLFF